MPEQLQLMAACRTNVARRGGHCPPRNAVRKVLLLAGLISAPALAQENSEGQAVYEHWCAPCHAPGRGHPGTQSLQLKYGGNPPAVLLERNDLSKDAIKTFVRQGVLSMAPFRKTEITDSELDALTDYMTR